MQIEVFAGKPRYTQSEQRYPAWSEHTHASDSSLWNAPVGGSAFFTNMKMAFSGLTLILFRMT